jgi:predicted Zn-dependent protease with MMP-like domain
VALVGRGRSFLLEPQLGLPDAGNASTLTDFAEIVQDSLDSLPAELRDQISNVEIVVDDEPPGGRPLLGLYQGVPLTRRGTGYSGALPDKITIYRGPLERLYGHDPELLRGQVRHVVLHEVAHHFGISDERLIEIDRY